MSFDITLKNVCDKLIKEKKSVFLPKEMPRENILATSISREKTNHLHWFIALEEIVHKNVF